MFSGEQAGEASKGNHLITLDVARGCDRLCHPLRHPREGTRRFTELLGGVHVECIAICISFEGAIAGSHGSVVGRHSPTLRQRNSRNAQGFLTELSGRFRPDAPARAKTIETITAMAATTMRAGSPFSMVLF
jgi:hypothetical protein